MKYSDALLDAAFRSPPYNHQWHEFEAHAGDEARALAWTMRTGKSKATIDKASYLYSRGDIDAVLIFAPNGVHANWVEREFPRHLWLGLEFLPLVWRSSVAGAKGGNRLGQRAAAVWAASQKKWWDDLAQMRKTRKLFVMSINTESMTRPDTRRAVSRLLNNRNVLSVFDESDDWGIPGSKRTHMARAVARKSTYRMTLSGTTLDGNLLAAWSQFELLKPGALGFTNYAAFKQKFAIYETISARGRSFPKLVGYQNEDLLRARIEKWATVVTRDQVADMPKLVFEDVFFDPTPEQADAYRTLKDSFLLDLENGTISVGERAPRFMKMQQVFSGFVIDEYRQRQIIPGANPRLDALSHQVYICPGKVVIWCQFQADIDFVTARLRAEGHQVVEYHGRISTAAKKANLAGFQSDRKVKALVGHVQAGARGLDMSQAQRIINYSHTFKARLRAQAVERGTAIGGHNVLVLDIRTVKGPDDYVLATTTRRRNVADAVVGAGLRDLKRALDMGV